MKLMLSKIAQAGERINQEAQEFSQSADQAAKQAERAAERGGEELGSGIEQGIEIGGRYLLAVILWWVRFGLLAATVVMTILALIRTLRRRPSRGLWIATGLVAGLSLLSHWLLLAVSPLQ